MFPEQIRTDMTIYNNLDKENGKWCSTQLSGVFWKGIKTRNTDTSRMADTHSITVLIPYDVETEKVYKKPKQWKQSPKGAWTIQTGDIVVKGFVEDIICSQKDLKEKYDEVYVVKGAAFNEFGSKELWHWEVEGV